MHAALEYEHSGLEAQGHDCSVILAFHSLAPLLWEREAIAEYVSDHPNLLGALPNIETVEEALIYAVGDYRLDEQQQAGLAELLTLDEDIDDEPETESIEEKTANLKRWSKDEKLSKDLRLKAKALAQKGEKVAILKSKIKNAQKQIHSKNKVIDTQINNVFDSEFMLTGITLAGFHIEAGTRTFASFSKTMITDIGDNAKPYLKLWYNAVRDYPGFDNTGMTPAAEVNDISDICEFAAGISKPKSRKTRLENLEYWKDNPKLQKRLQLEAKALAGRMKSTDKKRAALEDKLNTLGVSGNQSKPKSRKLMIATLEAGQKDTRLPKSERLKAKALAKEMKQTDRELTALKAKRTALRAKE